MTAIAIRDDAPRILAPNGQLASLVAAENNWYEGSRFSPNRSWIWFPVQDAKQDLDRYTRTELIKHARYLYKNSPLIRGLIERMVTLVVGSGFWPVFKSSNPKWNQRAKQVFRKKARNVHLGHRCSFLQYTAAMGRARFLDGEAFTVKTYSTTTYEDKIQGVEADRVVGTKGQPQLNADVASVAASSSAPVDGFNLNQEGCVASYNFKGAKAPYPADTVIQHYTPKRLGQYRGETYLASAINTARDVDDILALEKECVKDASARKDIIKTSSGQLDAETFRSLRYGQGAATPFALPADNNAKDDYYRVRMGAQTLVLKNGDEYTPSIPARPGSAWQGFMDFLSMTICLSSTFPPSTILPINVGGVDIRRDLDIAQKVVEPIQLDMACELDDIIDYLLMGEIVDGELKQDCPDDYMVRAWQFPQRVNVDRAQAQQDREDVARGLMTLEEYHGRYSQDSIEVEATMILEAKRRKQAIADAGFKDIKEFVQVLSLDPKMFQAKEGGPGEPPTNTP